MLTSGLNWAFFGLVAINLYALCLVLLRGPVFRTRIYRPMVLNIGLSLLPTVILFVTGVLAVLVVVHTRSAALLLLVILLGAISWLLMLPNSAYLITELNLSHRQSGDGEAVPLWYDIVLVLTLALSGISNTVANVLIVQLVTALVLYPESREIMDDGGSWIAVGVILVLSCFGMYLGRYLRFNSWDIRHPAGFVRKLVTHFRELANLRAMFGFVLVHAILLAVIYLLVGVPTLIYTSAPSDDNSNAASLSSTLPRVTTSVDTSPQRTAVGTTNPRDLSTLHPAVLSPTPLATTAVPRADTATR